MTVEIAVYVPLVCPARLFLMINSANTIDVNALLSSSTKRVHYKLLASLLWGGERPSGQISDLRI